MAWKANVIEVVLVHCGGGNRDEAVFKFYEQGPLGWYDYGMISIDGLPHYIQRMRKDGYTPCIHMSYDLRDVGHDYPIQELVWSWARGS